MFLGKGKDALLTAAASIFTEMALMGTAHASFDKAKRSELGLLPSSR